MRKGQAITTDSIRQKSMVNTENLMECTVCHRQKLRAIARQDLGLELISIIFLTELQVHSIIVLLAGRWMWISGSTSTTSNSVQNSTSYFKGQVWNPWWWMIRKCKRWPLLSKEQRNLLRSEVLCLPYAIPISRDCFFYCPNFFLIVSASKL